MFLWANVSTLLGCIFFLAVTRVLDFISESQFRGESVYLGAAHRTQGCPIPQVMVPRVPAAPS